METLLGVTLMSISAAIILAGASSLFKVQIKAKNEIYSTTEKTNKITGRFYFDETEDE